MGQLAMQALGKLFSSSLRLGTLHPQISSHVAPNNFTCVRSMSSLRPLAGFPLLSSHVKNEESLIPSSTPLLLPSRGQKKLPKLNKKLYGGGDNGGLDYGHQVMDWHRQRPHCQGCGAPARCQKA